MTVVVVLAAVGRSVVISGNMQCLIGGRVRQLERIGNGTTGDLAIVYIKTTTQMRVIVERPPPSQGWKQQRHQKLRARHQTSDQQIGVAGGCGNTLEDATVLSSMWLATG